MTPGPSTRRAVHLYQEAPPKHLFCGQCGDRCNRLGVAQSWFCRACNVIWEVTFGADDQPFIARN